MRQPTAFPLPVEAIELTHPTDLVSGLNAKQLRQATTSGIRVDREVIDSLLVDEGSEVRSESSRLVEIIGDR